MVLSSPGRIALGLVEPHRASRRSENNFDVVQHFVSIRDKGGAFARSELFRGLRVTDLRTVYMCGQHMPYCSSIRLVCLRIAKKTPKRTAAVFGVGFWQTGAEFDRVIAPKRVEMGRLEEVSSRLGKRDRQPLSRAAVGVAPWSHRRFSPAELLKHSNRGSTQPL